MNVRTLATLGVAIGASLQCAGLLSTGTWRSLLFAAGLIVYALVWARLRPSGTYKTAAIFALIAATLAASLPLASQSVVTNVNNTAPIPDYTAIAALHTHDTTISPEIVVPLIKALYESGTEAALDALHVYNNSLQATGNKRNGVDELTHVLGMAALDRYDGDVGVTFSHCRIDFGWGCYHGVIMAYLATLPDTLQPEDIATLCEDKVYLNKDAGVANGNCEHGMGHGLTTLFGNDTSKALRYCDAIIGRDPAACIDGAVSQGIQSQFGAMEKYIPLDDPLVPCKNFSPRHQPACYRAQVVGWASLFKSDWPTIAKVCQQAGDLRIECYEGIGRYVNGINHHELSTTFKLCDTLRSIETLARDACTNGAMAMDLSDAPSAIVEAACLTITSPDPLGRCWRGFGYTLYLSGASEESRENTCKQIPTAYQEWCRGSSKITRKVQP